MLWRRADLDRAGGIPALAKEVAEDAAATKVVRGAGLKVRLVDRPFAQPLGRRSAAEVWNRQLRWARLRRASFLLYFLPEILSGGVLPMIAVGIVANALGLSVDSERGSVRRVLVRRRDAARGRRRSGRSPRCPRSMGSSAICCCRALFFSALRGNDFVWRGNEMQVERMRPRRMVAQMRPQRMIARMRPRMQEIAQGGRRRLRALRARALSSD